jgi:hypothetical protein
MSISFKSTRERQTHEPRRKRTDNFLKNWLTRVAFELNDLGKRGALSQEWFKNGALNQYSWLHGRIFGALIRSVDIPFIPMVEIRFGRYFKADLMVVKPKSCSKADDEIAVIEYESTNSSDQRIWDKDLPHFEWAVQMYQSGEYLGPIPPWWIVLTTLPDCQVHGWPWWYGGKGKGKRDKNPLCYYRDHIHKKFKATWKRISDARCHLAWVNLGLDAIKVLNLDGKRQVKPWSVRLSLPQEVKTDSEDTGGLQPP